MNLRETGKKIIDKLNGPEAQFTYLVRTGQAQAAIDFAKQRHDNQPQTMEQEVDITEPIVDVLTPLPESEISSHKKGVYNELNTLIGTGITEWSNIFIPSDANSSETAHLEPDQPYIIDFTSR